MEKRKPSMHSFMQIKHENKLDKFTKINMISNLMKSASTSTDDLDAVSNNNNN